MKLTAYTCVRVCVYITHIYLLHELCAALPQIYFLLWQKKKSLKAAGLAVHRQERDKGEMVREQVIWLMTRPLGGV